MADEPSAAAAAPADDEPAADAAGEAQPTPAELPANEGFEPEIIVFACHYCAYAAADLAGSMRLQYPTNIRMIKLPCTGKLEVIHLLKALEAGADGVYAAGCMEGECHYLKGNLWAQEAGGLRQEAARGDRGRSRSRRDVQHVVGHGPAVRRDGARVHGAHPRPGAQPRASARRLHGPRGRPPQMGDLAMPDDTGSDTPPSA